ncbi:hypothetical protein FJZ28_00850 [Candidatus Peregrinibacteria bacterium]|nr:hypothetical protein [Candidatus Peregrinibacteria bacterium]
MGTEGIVEDEKGKEEYKGDKGDKGNEGNEGNEGYKDDNKIRKAYTLMG